MGASARSLRSKSKIKNQNVKLMKKLIVANWKMNPKSFKEASALFGAVKAGAKGAKNVEVIICPPAVWLSKFKASGAVKLGAQNCHWETEGAYTGELSARMIADAGANFVIVGHSERRQYMGETNAIINLKIKAALKARLKPILCVGEKEGEEMGLVVEEQTTLGLAGLSVNQMKDLIVAYEPVWAIGTGQGCQPDNALSANLFIKRTLTKLYSRFLADKTPVLYGGSVTSADCASYITDAQMDGVLVGGASLDSKEFNKIIEGL